MSQNRKLRNLMTPTQTLFLDPNFVLFCSWVGFLDMILIAICLPLIVWKLYFVGETNHVERVLEKQKLSRLQDEVEALRSELENLKGRGEGK